MSSKDTLATVLPALLRRNPSAVADGTVVQLIVADDKACRYFYTWAGDVVGVAQGVSDKVDLTLSLVSEDLDGLLDGTLDFDHALQTKRLRVSGDDEVLLELARAMRAS